VTCLVMPSNFEQGYDFAHGMYVLRVADSMLTQATRFRSNVIQSVWVVLAWRRQVRVSANRRNITSLLQSISILTVHPTPLKARTCRDDVNTTDQVQKNHMCASIPDGL
jgi:hypothetical protein